MQVDSCKLARASWLVQVGSCKLARASWLVQVGSCKLTHASWLGQVGSCKLTHASWLEQVGSCKLARVSWLVQVGSCKFSCVIRLAILPEEPFAMLSGKKTPNGACGTPRNNRESSVHHIFIVRPIFNLALPMFCNKLFIPRKHFTLCVMPCQNPPILALHILLNATTAASRCVLHRTNLLVALLNLCNTAKNRCSGLGRDGCCQVIE